MINKIKKMIIRKQIDKKSEVYSKDMNKKFNDLKDYIDDNIKLVNFESINECRKNNKLYFPFDYCVFYANQLDLHISPNTFDFNKVQKKIKCLLSTYNDSEYNIMKHQCFDDKFEDKLVAFALLDSNDLLCFEKNEHYIVYYDSKNKEIVKIADTWKEFEDKLY